MIDLNDFIIIEHIRKKPRFLNEVNRQKRFHCFCTNCGIDRGYKTKSVYNKQHMCRKCTYNTPQHRKKLIESHWSKSGKYSPIKKSLEELALIKKQRQYNGRIYNKKYYQLNKSKINKRRKKYESININHKISVRLRTRVCNAIKNNYKSGSAVRDLGCSIEELKIYLESKFLPGMSWDNYGLKGWHIDHIKPLSSFNLSNREEFLKACHYTNLQPLWAKDNLRKNKY